MRCLIAFLLFFSASSGWAADATVRDGDTIQLAGVTYRLDGIDAPEFDQICIDDHAEPWTCGVEARDQLANLIGRRGVRCEDLGPDKTYSRWHIGICTVDGETVSLNQLLVRQGFALNSESSGKARFMEDEAGAKSNLRGIWKGCFVAPQDFRADRMERAEPRHALDDLADHGADALLHLARRLVGEGDGEDLAWPRPPGRQNVGDAGSQDAGLAGAGAGKHQHRAIECNDRLALLWVEVAQIGRANACLRARRNPARLSRPLLQRLSQTPRPSANLSRIKMALGSPFCEQSRPH